MSEVAGKVLRFCAASESAPNGSAPPRRYERRERRSDDAGSDCGRGCCVPAHPGAGACASPDLRHGHRLPLFAVARTRDHDRLQRRTALREALAVDRRGTLALDSRRAVLLSGSARPSRPGARLAHLVDARRVRRSQAPERRGHVGRGLPCVLAHYGQASTQVGHAPGALAHWALTDGILLAYGLGLAVVPAAIFGLGLTLARPHAPMERAVALLTVVCTTIFVGQASLIAAGEAQRPLERYLFYVTPLLFLAFFAYVERGAPRRFLCSGLGCIGALLLSSVSLPGMTGTAAIFFDPPTLTGFARAAFYLGFPNASLLYIALPLALALLAFMLPLTRPGAPHLFAS